ncbi:MAG: Asp-tRNA(Asn)/Glu-tRNA(Gln) amidotransferase subunit GatB [Nanoarchaeota archaeon]
MVLIGLEVHATINKLNTKLFCSCSLPRQDSPPNTHTCPICLGHPGSKPVLNKRAFFLSLKLALALKCKIYNKLVFSRKTYFYPDLPKNYQITQYEQPLGNDGYITLDSGKKISIQRVHIEEDPGALVHPAGISSSNYVLIDYNRSGIPLCEIVTKPEISSPDEAREFLKKLQTIIDYLDVFDPASGVIKADANVSIDGGERIEVKNITGFKEIERAIVYEIKRQESLSTPPKRKETWGWDTDRGITYFQRVKEGEDDYGYIIDPDLVPIDISSELIRSSESELPELPESLVKRWVSDLNIDSSDAKIIANNPQLAKIFNEVSKKVDPVLAARWIRRELSRVLNYAKKELSDTKITSTHLIELLSFLEEKQITDQNAQKILEMLVEKPFSVKQHINEHELKVISGSAMLSNLCNEAINEFPNAVKDFRDGKGEALNFLVGQVIKKTKGQAKPDSVKEIMNSLL